MTHRETVLKELEDLYDPTFEVPPGLYIPVGSQMLVKEIIDSDRITKGGILIPGSTILQYAKLGLVYRIGESVNIPVRIGFKIAFDKTAFEGIEHDGVSYVILQEHQVKAIVPPENYLMPHWPDKEEKRRQQRIDTSKRIHSKAEREIERILNSGGKKE